MGKGLAIAGPFFRYGPATKLHICLLLKLRYLLTMPYQWTPPPPHHGPVWALELWPYRSLRRKEFAIFFGVTACLITLPLLAMLGSMVLWGILLPFVLMLWALWKAIGVSYRRGEVLESFVADAQKVTLTRMNADGTMQVWQANRYWATLHLHPKGGPVENYLTLHGGYREVEIGAFLDTKERLALYDDLKRALRMPQ